MAKPELHDWSSLEYRRSDFGELVRGKYAKRICESTNVKVEAEYHRMKPRILMKL